MFFWEWIWVCSWRWPFPDHFWPLLMFSRMICCIFQWIPSSAQLTILFNSLFVCSKHYKVFQGEALIKYSLLLCTVLYKMKKGRKCVNWLRLVYWWNKTTKILMEKVLNLFMKCVCDNFSICLPGRKLAPFL